MHVRLFRHSYSPTETMGLLQAGDFECHTIERPWIPGANKGGKPFLSCVPDGQYDLEPYVRGDGEKVLALRNPELNVYLTASEGGRYAILIHMGNYVTDVVGCIALGRYRTFDGNQLMVTHSRETMRRFHEVVPVYEAHTLTIVNSTGATDG